jgi:polyhydroxybutyrate depolymerase
MLRSLTASSIALVMAALVLAACSSSSSSGAPADAGYSPSPLIAARPYGFKEPAAYDPKTPTPLVVVLHGYGAGGLVQEAYLGFAVLAETKTFLLAYPDGTYDSYGKRFWNATDACCDFDHKGIDDVAYITAIIDDVVAQYNVDPKRIYLVGHSNGAFMSHRMACEISSRVAAIVTLAGMQWIDATKCNPTAPVAVLQVDGDADDVVHYDGGAVNLAGVPEHGLYPSAKQTVATWATKNGCTGMLTATGEMLDIDGSLAGNETTVERYDGCPAPVELWTIHGGGHLPSFSASWPTAMWSFLEANPKK